MWDFQWILIFSYSTFQHLCNFSLEFNPDNVSKPHSSLDFHVITYPFSPTKFVISSHAASLLPSLSAPPLRDGVIFYRTQYLVLFCFFSQVADWATWSQPMVFLQGSQHMPVTLHPYFPPRLYSNVPNYIFKYRSPNNHYIFPKIAVLSWLLPVDKQHLCLYITQARRWEVHILDFWPTVLFMSKAHWITILHASHTGLFSALVQSPIQAHIPPYLDVTASQLIPLSSFLPLSNLLIDVLFS